MRELKELNWMFSVSRSVVKLVNGILSERMLWIFFSSFRVLLCMYRYYYDYNIALFALNRRRQRINARKLQKGSMALVIQQYLVTKTGSEEEMTTHNVGLSFEKPRERKKNFFFSNNIHKRPKWIKNWKNHYEIQTQFCLLLSFSSDFTGPLCSFNDYNEVDIKQSHGVMVV